MSISPLDQAQASHLPVLVAAAPDVGTLLGLPDGDDHWPDPGPDGTQAALAALTAWESALDGIGQADLTAAQALDVRSFRSHLDLVRYAHQHVAARPRDPDVVTGVVRVLMAHSTATHLPDEQRLYALKQRLSGLPGYLAKARQAVSAADARWAALAADVAEGLGAFVAGLGKAASHADVPGVLKTELEHAVTAALAASVEHGSWVRNLEPGEGPAWQVGPVTLAEIFRMRLWPFTPDELAQRASRAVTDLTADARRFANRCRPGAANDGGEWMNLLGQAPEHPAEALAWLEQAAHEARQWWAAQGLAGPPQDEQLQMASAPAVLTATHPTAWLSPGSRMGRPITHRLLLVLPHNGPLPLPLAEIESLALTLGVPGQHLLEVAGVGTSLLRAGVPAGLFMERAAARWGQETRAGWGVWAERLARQLGFRQHAGARLYAALARRLDAQCAAVDVGLHSGTLTPSQARQSLVRTCGVDADHADRLVFRATRTPGELSEAFVGAEMMERVRAQARLVWKQQDSPRRFVELVLTHGTAPLSLLSVPPPSP